MDTLLDMFLHSWFHSLQLFSTRLVTGVNSILDDERTGGSSTDVSGHGLVFALHLQRQLRSSSKLIQLLRDDQSTLVRSIHCLKPLHLQTRKQVSCDTIHISRKIVPLVS